MGFWRLTKNLGWTLALAAGCAIASHADETWRMSHKMPPDSPEGLVFQRFADLVEEYSNGELQVKVFPNEQLGKTNAVLEQLKMGTVHLYAEGSTYMQKWVPEISWTSAAFLFDDREHWVRFMNSDMVQTWYDRAAEEAGVAVLGDPTAILRGPYRVMVTNRDVKEFEDIDGLPLRMHPNKDAVATWTRLGADVKTLPWTDVYASIKSGIVSAVNSPIALVESMRFYEVAPFVVRHDEYYQSIGFMINQSAYDALTDDQKAAVDRAYSEAGEYSFEIMGSVADESIERMASKGVVFRDIDRAPFVTVMQQYYADKEAAGELPVGFLDEVARTRSAN
ncbi:MAG: TRAP transporter substrate-binding protein [Albidovulum sp.]|nr:TRAP transporter substrate-binding protein [Albidovulum sp.]MDE0304760.1 TRAP transporter substrate-binding protein [Albidovulum sp.]MDE0534545.1 TRAP transporter substrate-binding protein [Albidovulum sp.]